MSVILVVDDHPENIYLMRSLLEPQGHQVIDAANGILGLERARQDKPDLVVSDILMPGMDGYQFCQECKADPVLRSIPFIFCTATYTSALDSQLAHDIGADEFIVKPVDTQEFIACVNKFVAREASTQVTVEAVANEVILKEYNQSLIQRLERKMLQLKAAAESVKKSDRRLKIALDAASAGVFDWDLKSGLVEKNDLLPALYGWPVEHYVATIAEFRRAIHPDDLVKVKSCLRAAKANASEFRLEYRVIWPNGEVHWLAGRGAFGFDAKGEPERLSGVLINIDERKASEEKLRLADSVFQHCYEGIFVTDADNKIVAVNPAFTRITGFEATDVVGHPPSILRSDRHDLEFFARQWAKLLSEGHWQGEIWQKRKDGAVFPELLNISMVTDSNGRPLNYVGVITDISDIKRAQERLDFLAHHDQLTQLPNRLLFQEMLQHAMASAQRNDEQLALLFMDLDHFKNINDSMGHRAGDILLKEVARRLSTTLRGVDTLARIGGDEFNLLVSNFNDIREVARVADRLIAAISQPFTVNEQQVYVGLSVGISIYPHDGQSAQQLQSNADAALYKAKGEGRGKYQFFAQELADAAKDKLLLDALLRRAIKQGELQLHYQPQVSLVDGAVIGCEALARWFSPELGFVAPDRFIPLAEENGQIIKLGNWALDAACLQMRAWLDAGDAPGYVAVNVSAAQLQRESLYQSVKSALGASGIAPNRLELEITESFVIGDPEAAITELQAIHQLGVKISIDDFGTGYSSLAYLKRLPVHRLKIDRTFVIDMLDDANDEAIVRSVIALGDAMGLDILAEGVETEAHADRLRSLGCNSAQGWLYGKPVAAQQKFT